MHSSDIPNPFSRFTLVLSALVLMVLLQTPLAADLKPVFGLKLACPREIPALKSDDSLLQCGEDEYVRCNVRVDAKGNFAGLVPRDIVPGARLRQYAGYFSRFRFRPGTFNGKSVAQLLPVTVYLFSDRRPPIVTLPVKADGNIGSVILYRQALELNGVSLPHLSMFPSYQSTLSGIDSAGQLRYVVVSLDLNPLGRPTRISLVRTNYPDFAGQILNAANWASYRPASVATRDVAAPCYLMITFLPSMQYPTKPLILDSGDAPLTLERLAVRLLPDTLGDLALPMPRYAVNWTYPLAPKPGSWARHGIFRYRIDAFGNADFVSGGNGSAAARQFGSELGTVMRFYPAVDWRGNPTTFEGVVKVTPRDTSNVRVEFLWLD